MSSKVFVSLPPDGFQQQIKKKHQDIVESDRAAISNTTTTDPAIRVNQLEQNIKFLQDQHQIMLTGLHREIEILRQKNRDLQFQIIFDKKINLMQSTSSSDEEFVKKIFPPDNINITPLQIEILERNIADLHTNLSEAKTRNIYLQNVIDDQKKKLSLLQKENLDLTAMNQKCDQEDTIKKFTESMTSKKRFMVSQNNSENLQEKLDDADRLIRRLRRENQEQKKEIVSLRTTMNKGKTEVRKNDVNSGSKIYQRNGQSQNSRFPPIYGHPHWRHRPAFHYSTSDSQNGQISERKGDRFNGESENEGLIVPSLPYLRDKNNASSSTGYGNLVHGNYQVTNYKRWYHYHKKQDENRSNGRPSRREQSHRNRSDR